MGRVRTTIKKHGGVLFLVGMVFFFTCAALGMRQSRYSDIDAYWLTMNKDGCEYMVSLGFKPADAPGGCRILARYDSGSFGSNGEILLDDDRVVEIGNGAILAVISAEGQLPKTPGQKRAFYIYLGSMAGMVGLGILIGMLLGL